MRVSFRMKKIYLAIGILILCSVLIVNVNAQQTEFGIKGGISPYTLTLSGDFDQAIRPRTHFGIMARFQLDREEAFSIQPELIYSLQGTRINGSGRSITLDYIQFPVLFQFEPAEGLRVQGGPHLGFLLTARSDHDGAAEDLSRKVRSRDFGLTTGVSYTFQPVGIGVDLRFNQGLRIISENSELRSRNRGFQVGLFYIFDFGESY
jgi:hypothetical protein